MAKNTNIELILTVEEMIALIEAETGKPMLSDTDLIDVLSVDDLIPTLSDADFIEATSIDDIEAFDANE